VPEAWIVTFWVSITNYRTALGKIPQYRFVVCLLTTLIVIATAGMAAAEAPIVDSFSATPQTVLPGGTVALSVDAHDPDCADICTSGCGQYIRVDLTNWSATAGTISNVDAGVSGSPYTSTADWQAPVTEGTYTISVFLADSGGFMCGGRASMTATIDVVVSSVISEPPVIDSVTANPTLIFPAEQSQLLCSATDPEGEDITYSWSTDRGGVTGGSGGTATFTAGDPGVATATCTATDSAGASSSDTVSISVVGAEAEKALDAGIVSPQRIDVTSWGDLYVADPSTGGLTVVNLMSGELVYRLPYSNVRSVAVNWNDDLLVASSYAAQVINRRGDVLLTLDSGQGLGEISDVAVDPLNRRYGVLYARVGRVVVFGETGAVVTAFGSTGDGVDQFRGPRGLGATPTGEWLIADNGHGQVKTFDSAGTLVTAFGGVGDGLGEFVQLEDVSCDSAGVIYATDAYQDWVVAINPDGTLRETFGTYGDGVGELMTASGVTPATGFDRLVAGSRNGSSLQVFKTTRNPVAVAPAPEASMSKTTLAFASHPVGTSSPSKFVTLTNTGDAPLGVRGVEISPDFRQTSDCESFLDPGQSCIFTVSFFPNRPGAITGTMVVDTSATNQVATVALSGTGTTPPSAVLFPSSLVFSGVQVGKTSSPQTVTLSNAGTDTLAITSIDVSGDYTSTTTCGSTLGGGAACTISVVFAPQTAGDAIDGVLTVVSNAAGSPHVVMLSGSSLPADATLSIDHANATEGPGNRVVFTVTMSGFSPETVTVEFVTEPSSAHADEDYTPASGSLTFSDGVTARTIEVPVVDDDVLEDLEETFIVELRNPVNATITSSSGTGTLFDDELCPSPNLLLNPDAEEHPVDGTIPGWTVVMGDWWLGEADPYPYEGDSYFAAGSDDYNELQQTVDVTAFADTIDADAQQFAFEAFVSTGGIDLAAVMVEYLDSNGNLLDIFEPGDISSESDWTRVANFRIAPPFTRQIRVRLIGQRLDGETAKAYFDHVALVSVRVPTIWIDSRTVYEGSDGETFETIFASRLACGHDGETTGWVWTSDGTALDGEDYLAVDQPFLIVPGDIEALVPVIVLGDDIDEDHEYFDVNLTLEPGPAVAPFGTAIGIIYNDDFCGQPPVFWEATPEMWPVDRLIIGSVEYDMETLIWLLSYSGSDVSHELARELVAAKLNLAVGSNPSILATVDEADAFLTRFPPGSKPSGQDKQEGRDLADVLTDYNDSGCTMVRRISGRREYCDPCGE
jgi:hypothetical protein